MRNIYVHPHDAPSLDALLTRGWLSAEEAKQLADAIAARKTIVVAGGTARDRDVWFDALLTEVIAQEPRWDVVVYETASREARILKGTHANALDKHVAVRRIDDEGNISDLLSDWDSHLGGLGTVEATSPERAVMKLAALASEDLNWHPRLDDLFDLEHRVRSIVDWVVCVAPSLTAILVNAKPADWIDPRDLD